MSLMEEIRQRLAAVMKPRDERQTWERDIYKLALSEITTLELRSQGKPVTEEQIANVLRKLIEGNNETLAAMEKLGKGGAEKLRAENEVLASLLPKTLSPEEIAERLAPVADAIRTAKSDGQAMGLAMKHLKSENAPVAGADVTQAVKQLRAAS